MAIQCLGGYGYCDDFPVEQYFRDTRIHPIHEGTTGVQGMDLLGRKVRMQNGKAFDLFVEEVQGAIAEGREHETTAPYAETLAGVVAELVEVTDTLRARATEEGIAVYLSDATLYLEYFSLVAVAWQWLRQAMAAARGLDGKPSKSDSNFYNGKLFSARYFIHYELPKTKGLVTRLLDTDTVTLDMDPAFFQD